MRARFMIAKLVASTADSFLFDAPPRDNVVYEDSELFVVRLRHD